MYATASQYLHIKEDYSVSEPIKEYHKSSKQGTPKYIENSSDPKVWGPKFWFSLHVSAAHYPLNASPIVRERMKNRILAIPYEIACKTCSPHASAFVEAHRDQLDRIVSGRHELGKFYVDFHNKVNERYGKEKWSYEKAYRYYSGGKSI